MIPPLTDDVVEMSKRSADSLDQKHRMDQQLLEAQRAAEDAAAAIREVRAALAELSFPFGSSVSLGELPDG